MTSMSSAEREREREVYKYHQPFYIAPNPAEDQKVPRSSWDVTLTAFAQLGALRLNAKRCLISLVTHDAQYIIAEATQSLSLRRDDVHEEDDNLWFGVCTLPKDRGICSHSVDVFAGHFKCGCEADFVGLDDGRVGYIQVNNLLEDCCSLRRKAAESNASLRFYVSVPIITAAGCVIGAYSIIDEHPRNGVSPADLAFLKDMASTIMDHLATTRVESLHRRAERMIKGMGLFVEGGYSLRQWFLKTRDEGSAHKSEKSFIEEHSLEEHADCELLEGLRMDSIEKIDTLSSLASSKRPFRSVDSESASGISSIESSQLPGSAISQTQQTSQEESTQFKSVNVEGTLFYPSETANKSVGFSNSSEGSVADDTSVADSVTSVGSHLQEAVLPHDLKNTFSRASNLIRESLAITGVLFLDASIGSFGGRSKDGMMHDEAPSQFQHASTPFATSSSDEEAKNRPSAANATGGEYSSSTTTDASKNCSILGYSTHNRSSLMMNSPSELHSLVPESFLRRLLKRYPHGKIFNLDEEGTVSSSSDEAAWVGLTTEEAKSSPIRKAKRKKLSKEAEFRSILEILPGARSIAFFPLWDTHKERWFAGGFLWTSQPTRIFVPEDELTFFAAFSNNIMAEVARLDALVAAQMKIKFISSISHELRSPLHGVLAGVELLQDSNLASSQIDMVKMIDACGKTLLDTINHILDFTKVNSKSIEKARKLKKSKRGAKQHLDQKTSLDFENAPTAVPDLAMLTEEVISSVYAGHNHRQYSALGGAQNSNGSVIIVMDVSYRDSYLFDIEAGAWRRLIMNLFSNALKYTNNGFIRISLQTKDDASKDRSHPTFVTLSVTDSGQGISSEFLQNHLFTPFHQESRFSTGTGLGLSIVRQIVDDLGGDISFTSEKEMGTQAMITLPLLGQLVVPRTPPSVPPSEIDLPLDIKSARGKTRGLRALFCGFDVTPDMDDTSGILSTRSKTVLSLKSALGDMLKDWFLMDVASSPTLRSSPADVYVILESDFDDLKASDYFDDIDEARVYSPPLPVVLVLSSMAPDVRDEVTKSYKIIKLQQPFGPHRIAKIFSRCFGKPTSSPKTSPRTSAPSISPPTSPRSYYGTITPSFPFPATSRIPESKSSRNKNSRSPSPRPGSSRRHLQISSGSASRNTIDPDPSLPKVLLVEDNEINLKLLVTYMRRLRVPHATASNGLEALQTYKQQNRSFDIILMDVSMPIMDGFSASREIRAFERIADRTPTTIIALTGAASPQARQEAFASGIDRYLTKPVPMKVLKTILDEFQVRRPERGKLEGSRDNYSTG